MRRNLNLFHYDVSGSTRNPVILFLHGFLGTGDDWHDVITDLSPYYHCISVDLPGHGQTKITADSTSCSIELCASGIIDLLGHLNIKYCYLVGYSMGGRIALRLALSYPNFFPKVILESTSPGLKSKTERMHRMLHDTHLAQELETKPLANFMNNWYQQKIFNSLSELSTFSKLKKARLKQNGKQLAGALRAMSTGRQRPLWNKLRKIKLPILLITGELDFKFTEIMQEMCHLLPQAELQIVAKCGHNVHFEATDTFVKLIRNFF